MIHVSLRRDETSISFEVTGHSRPTNGQTEKFQVCAGVSALLLTLWALNGNVGVWNGDNCGLIEFRVGEQHEAEAAFVCVGIQLINENYPGHIELDLGPGFEGEEWKAPTLSM